MSGKGELIASYSLEKGVDPYIATAIILQETDPLENIVVISHVILIQAIMYLCVYLEMYHHLCLK